MSSLAQSLSNIKGTKPDPVCPVLRILDGLDADDRNALESSLDSQASTRGIHKALSEHNIQISRDSITLHREKRCRCTRQEQS